MIDSKQIIKCPNCETEYLVDEIYNPDYFLGKHIDIDKDVFGKILYADGKDQCLTEEYICDKCNQKFFVKANITYEVTNNPILDMDKEYVSEKYKDRLFLKEE